MFALALHSRRENERRANEKRRATIAAGRLHQRASQISLDDGPPKQSSKLLSPPSQTGDNRSNTDQGGKGARGHRLVDAKGRSYSAITVIRTKSPEGILSAAGVSTAPEDGRGEVGTRPKSESDSSAPTAVVLRESSPRVLVVRMTPEQHKKAAERLQRQMTQPIPDGPLPEKEETPTRKYSNLFKKLSK